MEINEKLIELVNDYNMNKRLKFLNYRSPAEYLKEKNIVLQPIVSVQLKSSGDIPKGWRRMGAGVPGGLQIRMVYEKWTGRFDSYPPPPLLAAKLERENEKV